MTTSPSPTAAEALASTAPIAFEFEGLALTVKPTAEWTIRALDRLERGYITSWLERVLVGDSYKAILDADLKPEALSRLVPLVQKSAGVAAQ